MPHKNKAEASDLSADEGAETGEVSQVEIIGGENDGATGGPSAPARLSNEVLPCVEASAQTITGCTDAEIKNFLATADFIARQSCVQLADHWKGICKTARNAGKEEKAAKVKVAVGIDIDHTNLRIMDTKVAMSYSEKHSSQADTQEDLGQTNFVLS